MMYAFLSQCLAVMCAQFSSIANHTSDIQPTDLLAIAAMSARKQEVWEHQLFEQDSSQKFLNTIQTH